MLEEAGWTLAGDGVREKDGQKMELELLYNSDSVTEKAIAEYLQSEYQKHGCLPEHSWRGRTVLP